MRRFPLALVALLAFGACQKGTYLKLVFNGAASPPIHQIQVQLTLADGRVSPGLLPKNPAAGSALKMPASAVFILDDYSGALGIDAAAYDVVSALLASDHKNTTIMPAKAWTVEMNLAPKVTGVNASALDVTPQEWDSDLSEGTITQGNLTPAGSWVEVVGVNQGPMTDGTRPPLDLSRQAPSSD